MKKLELDIPSDDLPVDPLDIFEGSILRGDIENIWETQADALKTWHSEHRSKSDVVVQLNTGGGKTLVGLLMAQSLVNETNERVLYVCANNQLIEQTLRQAEEIGLSPAQRYKGQWFQKECYDKGIAFCLTNYHGLFNGLSVFHGETIKAIIFDDAHVAEAIIRDCFTVRIDKSHDAFKQVLNIFRDYYNGSPTSTQFEEISEGAYTSVLFVPMFLTQRKAGQLRKILIESQASQDDNKFPWAHIGNHLNLCCILLSGTSIEITPLGFPLGTLPYYSDARRIYLTATIPSQTSFARTFGVADIDIIRPSGKSGDAQRLFIYAPGEDSDEQRGNAKLLVSNKKSCVITPSRNRAQRWDPPCTIFEKSSGQKEIDRFKTTQDPEMLGLIARYDGIDLPGKACQILILDSLPIGENLFDRFIDEGIKTETLRKSHTATRITQAIGRIFRSNTDHGVVILVDPALHSWMRTPGNQRYLPERLQQQIQLADALQKKVDEGEATVNELIDAVLDGHPNWDSVYSSYISKFKIRQALADTDWYLQLVSMEREAYELLWQGLPEKAVVLYEQLHKDAFIHDEQLAAWYRHWKGLSYLLSKDQSNAFYEFTLASRTRVELGRLSDRDFRSLSPSPATEASQQARNLASRFRENKASQNADIHKIRSDLKYGDETAKAEEALKLLGELLGLQASRPDKVGGVGPDVIWEMPCASSVWGFELKTNKKKDSQYNKKDDIGQCHQHEQWLEEKYGQQVPLAIVGRFLPVSKKANPSEKLCIIKVESFQDINNRLEKVLYAVDAGDKSDVPIEFETWLRHYGLLFPSCVSSLDSRLAIDLKEE